MGGSARLDAETAEARAPGRSSRSWKLLSQQRVAPAFASIRRRNRRVLADEDSVWPAGSDGRALLLRSRPHSLTASCRLRRSDWLAHCSSLHFTQARRMTSPSAWAAFFALALCIGAIVATRTSASPDAEAMPAAIQSTTREQAPSYPVIGPTLRGKSRASPLAIREHLRSRTTRPRRR